MYFETFRNSNHQKARTPQSLLPYLIYRHGYKLGTQVTKSFPVNGMPGSSAPRQTRKFEALGLISHSVRAGILHKASVTSGFARRATSQRRYGIAVLQVESTITDGSKRMTDCDADVLRRVMQNVYGLFQVIADEEYQRNKWSVNSPSASWETFGELMASLFDGCDAVNLARLPRQSLGLSPQQYHRFQNLVSMLDGFTAMHYPISTLRYEHLTRDASWQIIVREAKKFVFSGTDQSD